MHTMSTDKRELLDTLATFARQRPGLEFANYGDAAAYNSEARAITRDLEHFRTLLRAVEWRDIDAAAILEHATRGRLTWNGSGWDYCTGQYFPTEYRKAACRLLASVLWDYTRKGAMPKPDKHTDDAGRVRETYRGLSGGTWLRTYFRREFGRAIASRYFD